MDLVGYLMQVVMPSEVYVQVRTLDNLELAMKPAKTYTSALASLREWHYKLRVARETLKAEPLPARLWNSVTALMSHLAVSYTHLTLPTNREV